jgi:hypothetical protein
MEFVKLGAVNFTDRAPKKHCDRILIQFWTASKNVDINATNVDQQTNTSTHQHSCQRINTIVIKHQHINTSTASTDQHINILTQSSINTAVNASTHQHINSRQRINASYINIIININTHQHITECTKCNTIYWHSIGLFVSSWTPKICFRPRFTLIQLSLKPTIEEHNRPRRLPFPRPRFPTSL